MKNLCILCDLLTDEREWVLLKQSLHVQCSVSRWHVIIGAFVNTFKCSYLRKYGWCWCALWCKIMALDISSDFSFVMICDVENFFYVFLHVGIKWTTQSCNSITKVHFINIFINSQSTHISFLFFSFLVIFKNISTYE